MTLTRREELLQAAAMIAAAIERLDRQAVACQGDGTTAPDRGGPFTMASDKAARDNTDRWRPLQVVPT